MSITKDLNSRSGMIGMAFRVFCIVIFMSVTIACGKSENAGTTKKIEPQAKAAEKVDLPKNFYKVLEGTIDTMRVRFVITRLDSVLSGYYFYYKTGKTIDFSYNGKFNPDNSLYLEEASIVDKNGKLITTGIIEAKFTGNGSIAGVWKKNKSTNGGLSLKLEEQYGKGICKADINHFEKSIKKPGENAPSITINLTYPTIIYSEDKAFEKTLNEYIKSGVQIVDGFDWKNKVFKNTESLMDEFIKSSKKDIKEQNIDYAVQYFHDCGISISRNRDSFICLNIKYYDDRGGAHGNSSSKHTNFIVGKTKPIEEKDLFNTGYRQMLSSIAEKALYKKINNQNVVDEIKSSGDGFKLSQDFEIKENGIEYYFNEGDLGSYALGSLSVLVPYTSIKSLIKPGGPLSTYVK